MSDERFAVDRSSCAATPMTADGMRARLRPESAIICCVRPGIIENL
jgi:hypothetical protein